MRHALVLASTILVLAGCTANPVATQNPSAKPVHVGWSKYHWRICEEGRSCPLPTPKTVVLPAPPLLQPMPAKAGTPPVAKRDPIVVHFELAQAMPSNEGLAQLESVLPLIRERDTLLIEGRTDDSGGQAFNNRLARDRAGFVATWLKQRGVRNPMNVEARGKCCYLASNDSETGRSANRRVEIHFNPIN